MRPQATGMPALLAGCVLLAGAAQGALLENIAYRQPRATQQSQLSPESIRLEAPRAEAAPTLDGRLAEDCWQQARAYLGSFRLGLSPEKARHGREAWVCYDSRNLYVAVRLQREPDQPLRVFTKADDDAKIWEDDEIELFFDPFRTGSEYYQIIINSGGYLFDATHRYVTKLDPAGATPTATKLDNLMDTGWSSGLRRKVTVDRDSWVAEMSLPLASLGLGGAPAGHELRFNITSADWDTKEYTCLSPTSDWQNPLQFGTIALGKPLVEVRDLDLGDIGLGRNVLRLQARDLTGQGGKRMVSLEFDCDAGNFRVEKALDLPAGGSRPLDVPFSIAARSGDWTARIAITDAGGQALYAARRAGGVPRPLLVRLGSQAVLTGGAPVPVAVSSGLGSLSASEVTLVAVLTGARGRVVGRQELGTPKTGQMTALMPVDTLKPGTYALTVAGREAGKEVARSAARLLVSASPFQQ